MSQASLVRFPHAWWPALLLALAAPVAAAQDRPAAPAPVAAASGPSAEEARESVGSFLGAPPELVQRLTNEQVFELLERKLDVERRQTEPPWIAGVVPVAFFAFVLLVVWFSLQHRGRQEAKRHETIRAMIDKGLEIPGALLAPQRARPAESPVLRDLRRGLLLICGGLGLSACFGVVGIWNAEAARGTALGLVPLFIGLGYVIVARLARKDERRE